MNEINEKLSALYDGELNIDELDDLIEIISKEKNLQKQISMYSLIGTAINHKSNNVVDIDSKKRGIKDIVSNIWVSNSLTAAASILLTLVFINNDFSRMNINIDSSKQISSAINSEEAKNIAQRADEYLTDHIMNIINDPNYIPMSPSFDGLAFKAAYNLIFEGKNQPSGYTEPILHETRLKLKNLA